MVVLHINIYEPGDLLTRLPGLLGRSKLNCSVSATEPSLRKEPAKMCICVHGWGG